MRTGGLGYPAFGKLMIWEAAILSDRETCQVARFFAVGLYSAQ